MKISSLTVGPIMTNCYLLADETTGVCAVIDPGDEPKRVTQAIEKTGCRPVMILLTHGHFDHWSGVAGLLTQYPEMPVYINREDVTDRSGGELLFPRLDEKHQRYYGEGDTVTVGSVPVTVWQTPGHSCGSVCLFAGDTIFCGDTLFYMSCGRTDLPGGSYREILESLGRLGRLEGDYTCLPGHDRGTTLAFERRCNPYMKQGMTL